MAKERKCIVPIEHMNEAGKMLEFELTGKLDRKDYESFVPIVERVVREYGKIRILVLMRDFRGWDVGALWEDIKFDVKHFSDIERIAMVGHKKWQEWMAKFCRPFTTAKIKYFDASQSDEARRWISES